MASSRRASCTPGAAKNPRCRRRLSDELFDYLASDLVDSVEPAVRELVFVAALCAGRTEGVVAKVIPDYREKARSASSRGLLSVRQSGALEVHPLIRELVTSKFLTDDPSSARVIGERVVRELARMSRWDECLDSAERLSLLPLTIELVIDAVPELLRTGRVATVTRWLHLATRARGTLRPYSCLARLSWRSGKEAMSGPKRSASTQVQRFESIVTQPAASSLPRELRTFAGIREPLRGTSRTLGRCLQTPPLRPGSLAPFCIRLRSRRPPGSDKAIRHMLAMKSVDPAHVLRIHLARAYFAFEIDGDVSGALSEMDLAHPLLGGVQDPMLRTNYLNLLATLCCYRSEYERSLGVVEQLLVEASDAGLEFVVDHAMVTRAAAQTVFDGLQRPSGRCRS